jgi:hypothetical protein
MKKTTLLGLALGLIVWSACQGVQAQPQVLDVVVTPRVFNNVADSNFDDLKALPIVGLADTDVSTAEGFANRHVWSVSADGATPLAFGIDDFFDISFDLVLNGTPPMPRKEAGILITTGPAGEGQFIVNTDAGEVVAFGGPLPFFAFHTLEDEASRVIFESGNQVSLRLRYFLDTDGLRKIEYVANGISSGVLTMANTEQGIPGQFAVSGYLQVVNDAANPDNRGVAVFDSITWDGTLLSAEVPPAEVPQPPPAGVPGATPQ